ncbi:TRAP transporter small permease [Planktotalea sp.]|uniref:TRAP transporter small permease n=1 Tax=Planktotalea sp. TaxID=2029877 RepID=UPI003298A8B1
MRFEYSVKIARLIHIVSSVWVFILAIVILVDVFGRVLFLSPLPGTKEILQNSVIMVTFLQIPLAIYSGSMLRTTLLTDALPTFAKRILRSLAYVLGFGLFAAIGYASFPEAMEALRLNEYEGEGSLRIYTWPIRFLMVATAIFAAFAYLSMLIADWTGSLGPDESLSNT